MEETVIEHCPHCSYPVRVRWRAGGGVIPDPSYVLVADWVYHSQCWDRATADRPCLLPTT
jgi:hypothetical protein